MKFIKEKWIALAGKHHSRLVLLMSVALVLLLGVQVYWIRVQLGLQEDRLNGKMHDVLLEIHHGIENDSVFSSQLITLFLGFEGKQALPIAETKLISQQASYKIDSVLKVFQLVGLEYDYAFYHVPLQDIVVSTASVDRPLSDYVPYSERAGYRVRKELGEGVYRFGIFFTNKFWYLLRQSVWLLGISLLLIIFLMASFMSTLMVLEKQQKVTLMHNDFINNLAHELKTPVFASSVILKIVQQHREAHRYDRLEQPLQLLEGENNLLKEKIEKVLDLSLFEAGLPDLDMKTVDLHDLITKNLAAYRYQAEARGGRLEQNLTADHTLVRGNQLHLQNLIQNLLDNALKYSPDLPHIVVHSKSNRENIMITVQDHGIGMSQEEQYHIFDKFYRVSNGDAHDTKGFGLGLSYVRKVTEMHLGQVRVKSHVGQGSSFTVCIPLCKNKKDASVTSS